MPDLNMLRQRAFMEGVEAIFDDSSFMTGASVPVDGGSPVGLPGLDPLAEA